MSHLRNISAVASLALAVAIAPNAANAQDESGSGASITITPRFQQLFYYPDGAEGLESLPTYGGTATVRTADQRWGLAVTYMEGKRDNGSYVFGDTGGVYRTNVKRKEFQVQGEYTPAETGLTFIAGYHHIKASQFEVLTNPAPTESEVNDERYSIDAAELGVRLSSRFGANSRHGLSAQLMVGVGKGTLDADTRYTFGGNTTAAAGKFKGTGYLADIAFGYNYFLTDNISLGARARGYVFHVDVDDAHPVFALIPEATVSFRF